jgi:N-acetylated-alpha-linked acidic dipeptidase
LLSLEESGHPHKSPIHKLIKAAIRVRKANQKIIAFERGFISEGGIKDREWYKHLGVAPGKWLGYGATTFPALTEALTIEKNVTLASEEASRLTELLDKLAHRLRQ